MTEKMLKGKTAWVTGSSRGLGRVVAAHLAGLGAKVAVHGTGRHSTRAFGEADSLDEVARLVAEESGTEVMAVVGDLADADTVDKAMAEILARWGRVDILVNCAGGDIGAGGTGAVDGGKPQGNDALHIGVEDIRTLIDRNLMACILPCRAAAPEMMRRKSGWIVNFGSISGLAGMETEAIYGAAKAAVHEYSRCLAAMLLEHNVYVNVVAPGGVVTPRFEASRPIEEELYVRDGTLKRYGWPDEVARAVEFFVTSASSYTTGQVLRVDGGKQLFPA